MSGAIVLSCGHEDTVRPHGYPFMLKEEGCDAVTGFHKQVAYLSWCGECFMRALRDFPENMMFEDFEADEYMGIDS